MLDWFSITYRFFPYNQQYRVYIMVLKQNKTHTSHLVDNIIFYRCLFLFHRPTLQPDSFQKENDERTSSSAYRKILP